MHPQSEGTIAQEALKVLFLIGDASLFINMPTHECTALLCCRQTLICLGATCPQSLEHTTRMSDLHHSTKYRCASLRLRPPYIVLMGSWEAERGQQSSAAS